jgi:magnesium transporter
MMGAFTSVISNNLNRVMKLLTSITICLSIPTIVASIWGMNVPVPWENYAPGFVITLVIAFGISSTLAIVFWRKRFF